MSFIPAVVAAYALGAFFASLGLTWLLARLYAGSGRLDVPNLRSSHTQPTPRGGGLAFVAVFLALLVLAAWNGLVDELELIAFGGSGLLVAAVGLLDDRGHVPARYRLMLHFGAAAIALFALGGLPPIVAFGRTLDLGFAGDILAVIFLVWTINLTNFMDGIDGIAASQAVIVAVAATTMVLLSGGDASDILIPAILAGAAAGFLALNFPPARIFMGDIGSGFLGMVLGVLAIWGMQFAPAVFWGVLIAFGVFVVDATLTLLRRLVRKRRVYEAHRSHAYQYASRLHGSHRSVTLAVAAIGMIWLLPLACAAALGLADGAFLLLVAYAPLVGLAWLYKAGAEEQQQAGPNAAAPIERQDSGKLS